MPRNIKYKYFAEIFQSEKTAGMPTVNDVYKDLALNNVYIPFLDDPPSIDELEEAINNNGKGVSFDGLPPEILQQIE